ncbi:cupin domain-containing protein [Nitratireductor sp. XY-223]|uniref:cupin domain-containing protein n=1 Tax=Nitratireductor sp. XY-223 TaxID=2561926 RepID=UPI0010A9C9FA|nr:cupin domain-containing protein [Nitratireductor sp. XY-223]
MTGQAHLLKAAAFAAAFGFFGAPCGAFADDGGFRPQPGSNTMLRAPLETAPGIEVIISDVVIPPNTAVPPHSHPGEEFVYVIEGSAVHREEGKEDRVYRAGEAFAIGRGKVHAPFTADQPARAIVFRVHVEGKPERIPAE